MNRFRAVICGGGIAAIEGLLRLRKLAGDSIDITVLAPNEELVMRPLAVLQPFAGGPPRHYPLKGIAADNDAEWIQDSLGWVDPDGQIVHTEAGQQLNYDALLVAVGARQHAAFDHVGTFRDADADQAYQGVVQDIETGYSNSIAFLKPEGPVYPLPLYELALLTAERAHSMDVDLTVTLVTPEHKPLSVFGTEVSDAVGAALKTAGVTVHTSAKATVPKAGELLVEPLGMQLHPRRIELHPQRMLAVPSLSGPGIRGLRGGGAHGFLPIDRYCGVRGVGERVYAAGDAADFPVKHGGLGAQMADSAASAIASLAGLDVTREEFNPVIRGKLLGGRNPLYISARLVGDSSFGSQVYDTPPWPEAEKVVATELGGYLAQLDEDRRHAEEARRRIAGRA